MFRVILFSVVIFHAVLENAHSKSVPINNEYDRMHPTINFKQSKINQRPRREMPMLVFEPPLIEEYTDYWNNVGQSILQNQLKKNILNTNKAKNIILFLADGMSIPTITAGRVYMGGEEKQYAFEKFPYSGLSKTYCANTQVADSACTATAYLSGVKANYGTIGVSAAVDAGDCDAQNNTSNHVPSVAEWAQQNGMATGVITTTAITHATPAGVYAHSANRNWQSDRQLLKDGGDPEKCMDIAKQLIHMPVGQKLNVVFGGGRQDFIPKWQTDFKGVKGTRQDNANLIDAWKQKHSGNSAAYIQTKEELLKLPQETEYVLGLFESDHMPFHLDADNETHPTLEEMVGKALDILERQGKGYFLFVEGGRIDHAHHDTEAIKAIDETIEFDKAIEVARRRTSEQDTLIVVTSDHSHTMSMAGYSSRKNDIFGINNSQYGMDELPYATLSYANGPGFINNTLQEGRRRNLKEINMHDKNYRFPSTVPLDSETHGGDDVAVFASGPYAHLFTGVYEQNLIAHALSYAACIGNKLTACTN